LNTVLTILAADAPPATSPQTPPGYMSFFDNPIFLMVILLLVFYIFMIRSKKKQEQQRQEMLNSLKKGDRIQTIGGILGTVVEARENEVLVKVDESSNTKIRFARSAIHRVTEEDKPQSK